MKAIVFGVVVALAVAAIPTKPQPVQEVSARQPIEVKVDRLSQRRFKSVSKANGKSTQSKAKDAAGVAKKVGTKCSGGTLKDRIVCCESGGSYTAQSPTSTASGKYQFLDTTWNNYKGYSKARYAPPKIQDEYFEKHFKENGTRPWLASSHCWR